MDLDFELGLQRLKEALLQKHGQVPSEFDVLAFRLLENVRGERLYGEEPASRAERAKIVHALNPMARELFDRSFAELCNLQSERNAAKHREPPQVSGTPRVVKKAEDVSWLEARTVVIHDEEYMLYRDSVCENWTSDRGAVWRCAKAQHLESHQKVWLKQVHIVHPSQEGEKLRACLQREHRLLVELEHEQNFPHAFLRPFLQGQDYTIAHTAKEGKTLVELFGRTDRLPDQYMLHTLLKSVYPLCKALNVLHRKQCSHRLLSPETILVLGGQRAVLQDLGLATWPAQIGEGQDAYQAPEQRYFNAQPILPGPQTDIFRLGAILYTILTGQPVSTASSEVKPSYYNGAIPPTLDEAVLGAVAANPQNRWRTIIEFATALKRALSDLSFSEKEQGKRSDE